MFRIDRIEAVEAAEPLPLPEGFEPGDGAPSMRRASDLEVTVRLAPEARWAEASFDAHDGRDLEDGSRRVRLTVLDLAWLPSFLAQFGGAAALEGPAAAVDAARAWFDRALALYGAAATTR